MTTPAALLERYVEAKDFTRPQLMRDIYAADALLTYSIATDAIEFPAKVRGVEGITSTLVVDFALRFDRCRTYYLCDAPPARSAAVAQVPWLVVMREPAWSRLRMGKGFYRWTFQAGAGDGVRVAGMHIHIERMDPIEDPGARLLERIQAPLPYPWLAPAVLDESLARLATSDAALRFLDEFRIPVDPAAVRHVGAHRTGAIAGG
jgi:hypothetical protein